MTSVTLSENTLKFLSQMKNKEKIDDYLNRAEAMIHVVSIASAHESVDINPKIAINYLYTIHQLIFKARKMNEKDLNLLLDKNLSSKQLGNGVTLDKPVEMKVRFSTREAECIKQLTEGKLQSEIAQNLNISERTVEFYLLNVTKKLNFLTTPKP